MEEREASGGGEEKRIGDRSRRALINLRAAGQDLAVAWAVAAVLGALSIMVAAPDAVARHIVLIAIMLTYLAYGLTRASRNTQRLADSVYFLGFLWTLYALSVTLVIRGGKIKAGDVFLVFGYALVTTAAGLFLRMFLIQFQRSVPDQIGEAREEIEAGVLSFTTEVAAAAAALQSFRGTAATALEAWSRELAETGRRIGAAYEETHQSARQETRDRLRIAIDGVLGEVRALEKAASGVAVALGGHVDHLAETSKALGDGLQKVKGVLSRRSEALDTSLQGVVDRLEGIKIPATIIQGAVDRVEALAREEVERLTAAIAAVVAGIEKQVRSLVAAVAGISGSEAVASVVAEVRTSVDEFRRAYADAATTSSALARGFEALDRGADDFRKQLAGVGNLLRDLEETVAKLAGTVAARSGSAVKEIEEAVREAEGSSRQVTAALAEILDFLRRRLNTADSSTRS